MSSETTRPAAGGRGEGGFEIRPWWGRLLIGRRPRRTLVRLVLLVLIALVVKRWCFLPMKVHGRSMEPTYRSGRVSAINRLAYARSAPRRGDVVGIQRAGRRMVLMKRVVGLPGERVQLRNGRVSVDGVLLDEPYARGDEDPPSTKEIELGPDQYFVIGDNRDLSEYGIVARGEIKGKVLF